MTQKKPNDPIPTENRIVKVYRKEHKLPILYGDGMQNWQKQVKDRCEIVQKGKPIFFGIGGRKSLDLEQNIQELKELIQNYEEMIKFIQRHKTTYQVFFKELAKEIQEISTEKSNQIKSLENKRKLLESQAKQNPEIRSLVRKQQDQLLRSTKLLGCAVLLMIKKLDLIQRGLTKLTEDQSLQNKILKNILNDLNLYSSAYQLQKEIDQVERDTETMAGIAVNFEKHVGQYLGSLAQLINQVVGIDEQLSGTLQEIENLTRLINRENGVINLDNQSSLSKQLTDMLTLSYQKQGRMPDALKSAGNQDISAIEADFKLLLANAPDSVTDTLNAVQVHVQKAFTQFSRMK